MFDRAIAFYEGELATGANPAAKVGWRTGEGYQLANLVRVCELADIRDGDSVLDVGCGLGALAGYLERIGRRVEYVGVDITPKMVDDARSRHPNAVFEVRDILAAAPARTFDVVVCSGTLNYRIDDHARWTANMLSRMYELANRVLVVNFLNNTFSSTLRGQLADRGEWVRVMPEEITRFCRQLSADVELHDQWASVFELVLRKSRERTLAELARTLDAPEDPVGLDAVISYAFRRRLHAELRDYLCTLAPTATILENLAHAHLLLGDEAQASAGFEQATALDPVRPDPCAMLGRLHLDANRDAEAQRWYREALVREPTHEAARFGLVVSLARSGQHAEARSVALDATGPLRDLLDGRTQSDPDAALAAFERALSAAPRAIDTLVEVAQCYELRDRWREAVALWMRAVDMRPESAALRERLRRAQARV